MSHSLLLMIEAKCWKTEPIRHQNCYDDSNDVKNGDVIASSCLTTRRKFKIQEKIKTRLSLHLTWANHDFRYGGSYCQYFRKIWQKILSEDFEKGLYGLKFFCDDFFLEFF